jgi:hypothetical protein
MKRKKKLKEQPVEIVSDGSPWSPTGNYGRRSPDEQRPRAPGLAGSTPLQ